MPDEELRKQLTKTWPTFQIEANKAFENLNRIIFTAGTGIIALSTTLLGKPDSPIWPHVLATAWILLLIAISFAAISQWNYHRVLEETSKAYLELSNRDRPVGTSPTTQQREYESKLMRTFSIAVFALVSGSILLMVYISVNFLFHP